MKKISHLLLILSVFLITACGKDFLEVRRSKEQVVPSAISDYQSILDRWQEMNASSSHELSIIGADEYYVSDDHWELLRDPYQQNGYIWGDDVYEGEESDDWNAAYFRILLANLVLEGIGDIKPATHEQPAWNGVKGSALFFRAWNHYQLSQLFCKPYDVSSASTDMGIPIRLTSDVSIRVGRGTVEATYQQILDDLVEAVELLPIEPQHKTRPSKSAALALLARVSLMMGDYTAAGAYAEQCLSIKSNLIDFNELNLTSNLLFPFDYGMSNPEVLFLCFTDNMRITSTSRFHADTLLVSLYDTNDLRLKGYFRDIGGGRLVFKGSYLGDAVFFTGLATDEVYLILAECNVRNGYVGKALTYLNTLLQHRFDKRDFTLVNEERPDELLQLILTERRKELLLRGTRWEDLRRLNAEGGSVTLRRKVLDTLYELTPYSPKWTWPIPDNEIMLGGLTQNER